MIMSETGLLTDRARLGPTRTVAISEGTVTDVAPATSSTSVSLTLAVRTGIGWPLPRAEAGSAMSLASRAIRNTQPTMKVNNMRAIAARIFMRDVRRMALTSTLSGRATIGFVCSHATRWQ